MLYINNENIKRNPGQYQYLFISNSNFERCLPLAGSANKDTLLVCEIKKGSE